jgi:hypothetical protein
MSLNSYFIVVYPHSIKYSIYWVFESICEGELQQLFFGPHINLNT